VPARVVALGGIALAVVALVVVLLSSGSSSAHRTVRAGFSSAEQLVPGLEVRVAGRKVGEIKKVQLVGGRPVVTLEVTEDEAWPLPKGTTAEVRWGSTTSLEYRFVSLHPGRAGAPPLPDGALLPEARNVTPIEFDQFYRIFRGRTTGDLRRLVGELGDTLEGNGDAVRSGLHQAPGGIDATSSVLRELGADRRALGQLVTQGDRVTGALASRSADLGPLIDHLAGTIDEFGQHTRAEQASLDRGPGTLDQGTTTLARLDRSLTGLGALVDDVAPGAVQLRELAPVARRALRRLSSVSPLAITTLRAGTRAAAPLARLLDKGTGFLPRLGAVTDRLAPMVDCVLAYAPEITGTLSTWSGFNQNYDADGHYARTFDLTVHPLLIAGTSATSQQAVSDSLHYAMPRPPGLNGGKPWLREDCGAGAAALDAAKDPEIRR
jgi:phospholipid/cholesterol/gamma-HCH transport system substrate-binding protein